MTHQLLTLLALTLIAAATLAARSPVAVRQRARARR
jgi:hypothetical protein